MDWSTPVTQLAGVGQKTSDKLAAAGYRTIGELALHVPSHYEDRRGSCSLEQAEVGQDVLVEGVVRRFRQRYFRGRYRAQVELAVAAQDGSAIPLVAQWFHRVGGLAERAGEGMRIQLYGTLKRGGKQGRGRRELVHPRISQPGAEAPAIVTRYPAIAGLGDSSVAKYCRAAAEHMVAAWKQHGEWLVPQVVARHRLPSPAKALTQLHFPSPELSAQDLEQLRQRTSPAHRRLTFENLLAMQLKIAARRRQYLARPQGLYVAAQASSREQVRAVLPFEPTAGQWAAIDDIEADLQAPRPMLRLLQGDVGCGKTAVAFAACMTVVQARGQVAWMVPTELLANQHAETVADWCRRAGIRCAVLTARMPAAKRRTVRQKIADAQIDLVIGTHALLGEGIRFARLGLSIIDEQHRFGVAQRALLRDKGTAVHLLVMTATPIPRTLALTTYGELDVSVIRELPPGRQRPNTELIAGTKALVKARQALAARIEQGAQAFVVCPRIEKSGALDISHVEGAAEWFSEHLPRHRVAVVHSKCPAHEIARCVQAFAAGKLALIVATTVIEVGIDLPSAGAMLIEHADRFGLAQLHQLRGRVGRGTQASVCYLHTQKTRKDEAHTRLQVLVEARDGFAVAEQDLALRGPGEIFGTRQAGTPGLFAACLIGAGIELLLEARKLARSWMAEPTLPCSPGVHAYLRRLAAPEHAGEVG